MEFLDAARGWIGTPFHWHQRVKGPYGGCDCIGLIHGIMIEMGILPQDFEFKDYGNHNPDITPALESLGESYIERISAPENGCIISFEVLGHIQHLGIKDGDYIIHANQIHGVEKADWAYWRKRAHRHYKLKEG